MLAIEMILQCGSYVMIIMLISWNSFREVTMLAIEILLGLVLNLSIQNANIMESKYRNGRTCHRSTTFEAIKPSRNWRGRLWCLNIQYVSIIDSRFRNLNASHRDTAHEAIVSVRRFARSDCGITVIGIYLRCHVELSLMVPILISHRRISNRIASLTVVQSISCRSFICNPQPGETQSIWPMIEVVQRVSRWWLNESHMLRVADRCFEHRIWCITRAVFWTAVGLLDPVVAPLSRRLAAHIAERCAASAAHGIACVL